MVQNKRFCRMWQRLRLIPLDLSHLSIFAFLALLLLPFRIRVYLPNSGLLNHPPPHMITVPNAIARAVGLDKGTLALRTRVTGFAGTYWRGKGEIYETKKPKIWGGGGGGSDLENFETTPKIRKTRALPSKLSCTMILSPPPHLHTRSCLGLQCRPVHR